MATKGSGSFYCADIDNRYREST